MTSTLVVIAVVIALVAAAWWAHRETRKPGKPAPPAPDKSWATIALSGEWPHPDGPPLVYYDAGARSQPEAEQVALGMAVVTPEVWPMLLAVYSVGPARPVPVRDVYLSDALDAETIVSGPVVQLRPRMLTNGRWDGRDRRPWLEALRLTARRMRYGDTSDAVGLHGDSEAARIVTEYRWPSV